MNLHIQETHTDNSAFGLAVAESSSPSSALAAAIPPNLSLQLIRMFRDPRVLEAEERRGLITDLRRAVEVAPHIAEVRVLLGMALAVNLEAQESLEQLRIAAEQAPDSFIARLKYGELLMRLRIAEKAAAETHQAARLALNAQQSELARTQAEKIRIMQREGIERGGNIGVLPRFFRRNALRGNSAPALAATK